VTLSEIKEIEKNDDYFVAFEELLQLHKTQPDNLEIFLRLFFLNWYCLTLLTTRPKEIENKLLDTLPGLTNFGLTHFKDEPEFLVILSNICSRFFFYLFGVPETYGEELCEYFIKNYPEHPIAGLYKLSGKVDNELRLKIIDKRKELIGYVQKKYPSDDTFDKYFRDTFTNIDIYNHI